MTLVYLADIHDAPTLDAAFYTNVFSGDVRYEATPTASAAQGDPVAARAAFIARQPLGRVGDADEIAALVLYLASDESAYTTGAIHVIDGGWSN